MLQEKAKAEGRAKARVRVKAKRAKGYYLRQPKQILQLQQKHIPTQYAMHRQGFTQKQ